MLWSSWILKIPGFRSVCAGLVGGVLMAAYEMIMMWILGPGLLQVLYLISSVHPYLEILDSAVLGMGLHLTTACFWSLKMGVIWAPAPTKLKTFVGASLFGLLYGLAIWILMGLIIGPLLNPNIAQANRFHFFVGHLFYGVGASLTLHYLLKKLPTKEITP